MRYTVLATDYDGTLASHGQVHQNTLEALQRVKASGRKLILVTGRHLEDLKSVFPQTELFDCLVVENGALLYYPGRQEERTLCEGPPEEFLSALRELNVPFETGRCIVATWVPHHTAVLDAVRGLALDLQVIFNKGAVMVLPSGVNKATGLHAALHSLHLSLHNTVGIGDAENDHALISACKCGVATANAVAPLKQRAHVVTKNPNGNGVIEIIDELLEDDLARYDPQLLLHPTTAGTLEDLDEEDVEISPYKNRSHS
jgi:hydroxymethylpyrimidine pyrophosphatase-like HAD family hydrolase